METQQHTENAENPFDQATTENTAQESSNETTTESMVDPTQKSMYHAVCVVDGRVDIISSRTKANLTKELDKLKDFKLVSVFRGKIIPTREKTTLELM